MSDGSITLTARLARSPLALGLAAAVSLAAACATMLLLGTPLLSTDIASVVSVPHTETVAHVRLSKPARGRAVASIGVRRPAPVQRVAYRAPHSSAVTGATPVRRATAAGSGAATRSTDSGSPQVRVRRRASTNTPKTAPATTSTPQIAATPEPAVAPVAKQAAVATPEPTAVATPASATPAPAVTPAPAATTVPGRLQRRVTRVLDAVTGG